MLESAKAGNREGDMTFELQLGNLIRRKRAEKGWSQAELARRIVDATGHAIKQSDISRIERGDISLPRFERLAAFSLVLDIPVSDLIRAATRHQDIPATSDGHRGAVSVDVFAKDRSTKQ